MKSLPLFSLHYSDFQLSCHNTNGRDYLKNPSIDARMLKCIFEGNGMKLLMDSAVISSGLCEHENEPSGFIKFC
jgi:hypothetical protein